MLTGALEAAKDDMSNRAERRDKGRWFEARGANEGVRGHDGRTDGSEAGEDEVGWSEGPTMMAGATTTATIMTVELA